jgi:hypothetical protein
MRLQHGSRSGEMQPAAPRIVQKHITLSGDEVHALDFTAENEPILYR